MFFYIWAKLSPLALPLAVGGSGLTPNTTRLGFPRVFTLNRTSIRSAVFAQGSSMAESATLRDNRLQKALQCLEFVKARFGQCSQFCIGHISNIPWRRHQALEIPGWQFHAWLMLQSGICRIEHALQPQIRSIVRSAVKHYIHRCVYWLFATKGWRIRSIDYTISP